MNRATVIINLLRQGVSPRETAEATGCSLPNVYATARRYGVTMSGQPSVLADRKAEVMKLLADGIGYREMARLLGVTRNTVKTFCRNNNIEQSEQNKQRNIERTYSSEEHECPECGALTTKKIYCSDKCRTRHNSRNRRMAKRNALVDKDITLHSLYKRDGGQCYICGLMCRWDDYTVREGGVICGDWYPSVEHLKPLSRGGTHSWDNIKLAHRRCNCIKGTTPLVM